MALDRAAFCETVWALVAGTPPGKVISYGQLALLAGRPDAPRLAGWAMRRAPAELPCHRVVHTDGSLAPTELFHGLQRQMLEQEGVVFTPAGRVNMRLSAYGT